MNDTKIASKAKAQLSNFMGKVFTHFSKPTRRFIEEYIYALGDTKRSSVVCTIDNDIRPIYTEKRLSRNLNNDKLSDPIAQAILMDGAVSVTSDTLLVVDPTKIRKEYSYKMQYVTRSPNSRTALKISASCHMPAFATWRLSFSFRRISQLYGLDATPNTRYLFLKYT